MTGKVTFVVRGKSVRIELYYIRTVTALGGSVDIQIRGFAKRDTCEMDRDEIPD